MTFVHLQIDSSIADITADEAKVVLWHVYMQMRQEYCSSQTVLQDHNVEAFINGWLFYDKSCVPWFTKEAGGHDLAGSAYKWYMKTAGSHKLMQPKTKQKDGNWPPPRTAEVTAHALQSILMHTN